MSCPLTGPDVRQLHEAFNDDMLLPSSVKPEFLPFCSRFTRLGDVTTHVSAVLLSVLRSSCGSGPSGRGLGCEPWSRTCV